MLVFIDSTNPEEISKAKRWGAIDGVTTNPSLIAKGGPDMRKTLEAVLEASPGPVLCQAIGVDDVESLVGQAKWLGSLSERIVVKLPMSQGGIMALLRLKRELPSLRIAVTLVSSLAQAYLVGKAGADIVALFNGALEQSLDQDVDLVGPVKKMYSNYGFQTKILSCGRYPRSFGEYAVAGTDICTLKFDFISLLYEHPFTDKRMRGFLDDWKKAFGDATWPKELR
jgi:transaldolase